MAGSGRRPTTSRSGGRSPPTWSRRGGPRSTSSTAGSALPHRGRRRRAEHPRRRARGDRHPRRPRPRPHPGRHPGPLGRRPPRGLGRARGRRGHPRDLPGRRPRPGRGRPRRARAAARWRRSSATRPARPTPRSDPRQQLPLGVPVWCVHATDDDTVPISQSREYVAAATAAGAQAELVEVAGDHFVVIDPGPRRLAADPGDPRRDRLSSASRAQGAVRRAVGCLARAATGSPGAGWRSSARSCGTARR